MYVRVPETFFLRFLSPPFCWENPGSKPERGDKTPPKKEDFLTFFCLFHDCLPDKRPPGHVVQIDVAVIPTHVWHGGRPLHAPFHKSVEAIVAFRALAKEERGLSIADVPKMTPTDPGPCSSNRCCRDPHARLARRQAPPCPLP